MLQRVVGLTLGLELGLELGFGLVFGAYIIKSCVECNAQRCAYNIGHHMEKLIDESKKCKLSSQLTVTKIAKKYWIQLVQQELLTRVRVLSMTSVWKRTNI